MEALNRFNMDLTAEERAILRGDRGEILRKAMESIIIYGSTFDARRLVPIDGAPHLVISVAINVIKPYFEMMNELIAAELQASKPFTVDPRPVDYENVQCSLLQKALFKFIFGKQKAYEEKLVQLGLRDLNAFTCTCYLPEVGNIPKKGDVLAWSESSAVVFANSVLGAKTNRNSAGIDLLCNIVGKAPLFGLLTDEGRRATWLVEVKTSALPNAQLLGSAIGMRVVEEVPYVIGVDRFLDQGLNDASIAYLKDMGAAAASNGAVGLFHMENITPEAMEMQRDLLVKGYQKYVVDDAELEQVMRSYPVLWKREDARPYRCFVGCPHLTFQQVIWWTQQISEALDELNQKRVKVDTILCAAPDVVESFKKRRKEFEQLATAGVKLTSICPLMYMSNPLTLKKPVMTNSNKLRTYSNARFFLDEQVLKIICRGYL
jgi:predicted aconitase